MAELIDERRAFRELVAELVDGNVAGLAHDLANQLLAISAFVGRVRRAAPARSKVASDLREIDEAFGRSVVLTRALRERLTGRQRRRELTSLTQTVCELTALMGPAMPDGIRLAATYPPEPCVVVAPPAEVFRVLVGLVAAAVDGLEPNAEVRLVARRAAREPGGDGVLVEIHASRDATAAAPASWAAAVERASELAESFRVALEVGVGPADRALLTLRFALVC